MIRTYEELRKLKTFSERFKYLQLLDGQVGVSTFGGDRYLNQQLYRSREWRHIRNEVILRDGACDLGIEGHDIFAMTARVHHINPITAEQIRNHDPIIFDLDNLILCSLNTHNAIHYGDEPIHTVAQRLPNDTCPWKGGLNDR